MKIILQRKAVVLFPLLIGLLLSAANAQTTRPVPAITHVVIISIDGCRPDVLLRADTPVIHGLLPHASFTFWARTTAESVTLPSHTSMLTGVVPIKHTIQWNMDLPLGHPVYPAYPTLFQLARKAGYTTAMAAGKSKFIALAVPGSLDEQFIPDESKIEDPQVTDAAVGFIRDHQPQVLFVHLPTDDNVGHAKGWGTAEQMAALAGADACIGRIIKAIDQAKLTDSTAVIITSDHGGFGRQHGPDDPRCRYIPWICFGPGIRQNLDLTTLDFSTTGVQTVDTEDTFCTACYLLGIPIQRQVDGKAITQIVQRDELLDAK
jgi:predicted AlkP superfamily pyrophosphatase or phosphodiesterase